ncbi:unnamed protein product [Coregonus sp. 'balchen']|nr:unnamed protein product [Coregonus sp. 'balchen']
MALQLQLSTYTEEFSSPGRGKPARPRPSSAHRRNNPHPRPDFLLPRKLQTSHRASRNMDSSKSLQQRPAGYLTDIQCNRGDLHPHSSQGLKRNSGTEHLKGLQNGSFPVVRHLLPQTHYRRSRSNTTQDSCGGYSCFNVVKPYQAGYYIIHPEFVSECLC